MTQRVEVELRVYRRMRKDRFRFGRVDQLAVKNTVIQRLFAKAVAGDEKSFATRVPQRKGEHSIQMIDHRVAVSLIKMRQNFGVGLRRESMALLFELRANLAKIVKFAIHHSDDAFVFAKNWLVAGLEVDDR